MERVSSGYILQYFIPNELFDNHIGTPDAPKLETIYEVQALDLYYSFLTSIIR